MKPVKTAGTAAAVCSLAGVGLLPRLLDWGIDATHSAGMLLLAGLLWTAGKAVLSEKDRRLLRFSLAFGLIFAFCQLLGARLDSAARVASAVSGRLSVQVPRPSGTVEARHGPALVGPLLPGVAFDFAQLPAGPGLAGHLGRVIADDLKPARRARDCGLGVRNFGLGGFTRREHEQPGHGVDAARAARDVGDPHVRTSRFVAVVPVA